MSATTGKIFGIGLSKTGTTSLTRALQLLGYRSIHFPFFYLKPQRHGLQLDHSRLERWDAITDSPIPCFYKQLDKAFPGSKFVLTVRDINRWLDSCEYNHIWPGEYVHNKAVSRFLYVNQILQMHHALYGSIWFDRMRFNYYYQKHIDDVMDYFSDRPDDLLIYNISGGEQWAPLCEFLNKQIPDTQFPKENIGKRKKLKKESRRLIWKSVSCLHLGHTISNPYLPVSMPLESA